MSDRGTHQPYLAGRMLRESLIVQATCRKRCNSKRMAVQLLYVNHVRNLIDNWQNGTNGTLSYVVLRGIECVRV
jgi:hypothetical protein